MEPLRFDVAAGPVRVRDPRVRRRPVTPHPSEVPMSSVRTLTLADAAIPHASALRDATLILGASLVTALAAQIAVPVPWSPVPMTGQTFAVLLTGAVLGARRALLAQILYLIEGASGLPVFAGGTGGPLVFAGPSAGYLLAFPWAAALIGALAERGWDRRFATTLAAMLAGSVVILILGLAMLSRFVGGERLLAAGLLAFVPGDILKAVAASLALPAAWGVVNGRRGRASRDGFGA
jgi:biotin transport system substrate-specific component